MEHKLIVKVIEMATGRAWEREFRTPYDCRLYVNKVKHSKKLSLVSYPKLD